MNELILVQGPRKDLKHSFRGCLACGAKKPLIPYQPDLNEKSAPGCSPQCSKKIAEAICGSLNDIFEKLLDVRWGTLSIYERFTELNVVTCPEYDVYRVSRFRIDHDCQAPIAGLLHWMDKTWEKIAVDQVTSDSDVNRGKRNWDFIANDPQGRTLVSMIGKCSVEGLLASTVVTDCSPRDLGRRLITRESLLRAAKAVHPDHNPKADDTAIRQINEMLKALRNGIRFHGVLNAFSYSRIGTAWLNPPMISSGKH